MQEAAGAKELGAMLLGRTGVVPGRPDMLIADRLTIFSFEIATGDFVSNGAVVGEVKACAEMQGALALLVLPYELVADSAAHAGKYRLGNELSAWRADAVQLCIVWRPQPDGATFVVRA